MAAYALLIGTRGQKRELLADGDPREVRRLFKTSDGEGFERLEVIETSVGRSRSRYFKDKFSRPKTADAEDKPKRRGRQPKES